jgi:asparagine synthase (glutamine-hydrolysing)
MADALAHRGPDGEGFFEDESISLGQKRLSIIDLEGGKQPIANEDESIQLVCNGEIYNSPELRRSLRKKGHTFRTRTDVEVIIHLYEEYGNDCVRHLRGMFAFALWDAPSRTLLLARDHMGQKPLFYYFDGEQLLFASEIKAILASGRVAAEPNIDALWHYISLRYIPDDYSLFRNIRKVEAGTTVLKTAEGIRVDRYWDPVFTDKLQRTEQQIEDELDSVLREVVKLHLLSDVPVGAFLSGGIDSSTVAAIMADIADTPVPSFSIGVKEQSFNELPYARMVAKKYGMTSHERVVSADLIQLIPSMIHHMDEPSDPYGVGVYLVSALAAEHVKVVLGGDGGDESFAGYDRYRGQSLAQSYSMLPAWMRKSVMPRLIGMIPESFGYNSLAQKAAWLNDMSFYRSGERYAQSMSFLRFTEEAKASLFTEQARRSRNDESSTAKILKFFDAPNAETIVDKMLYTDLMTRMPDHLLVIGDRMSMAHSLESRPTLVDYRLVEFAASIPSNLKLKGGELKYILKRTARRYLPDELINRKKQGFSFPIGHWLRTDLKDFMARLFAESRFVELGIFQPSYLQSIMEQHVSGAADHNYRLWILINLEIWYRMYFEGETIQSMNEYIRQLSRQAGA